jgi:FkbM family methyltransferase
MIQTREIELSPNGGIVFIGEDRPIGDVEVINEVWYGDDQCCKLRFLGSRFQPGSILDIGANIGIFSRLALSIWPGMKISAIEPWSRCVELLKLNVPSAKIYQGALLEGNGEIVFVDDSKRTVSGFAIDKDLANNFAYEGNKDQYVLLPEEKVTRLDINEIIKDMEAPILVKMDCEGGEYGFLEQINEESIKKIHLLMGEFHQYTHPQPEGSNVSIYFQKLFQEKFKPNEFDFFYWGTCCNGNLGLFQCERI